MTIYDYSVVDANQKEVSLSSYRGKVLLIVNTATHCGFTPTYKDLEATYVKYKDKGFEILDFPCNQFGKQAPEEIAEINSFCSLNFGTTFPRFAKINVNGEKAAPLYKFLESEKGFQGFDPSHKLTKILIELNAKLNRDWDKTSSIKWNFTKFLVGRDGRVIARYEPTASFDLINAGIEMALAEKTEAVMDVPQKIATLTLAVTDGCSHCLAAERTLKKHGIAFETANWMTPEGKALISSFGITSVPVLLVPSPSGVETVGGDKEITQWAAAHGAH